jgi:hypothetical protein
MATLLVGRRRCLRNQTAAEESVDESPHAEQICQRREVGLAVVTAGFEWLIGGRRPIGPARRDERAAAVWKHDEQQQSATTPRGAHDRQ